MEKFKNVKLDKMNSEHLYIQLVNIILEMIESRVLKPDDKLPPIRKLANLLDVNNVTIVKAYKYLEENGLLYKRVGSGTFVAQRPNLDEEDVEPKITKEFLESAQIELKEGVINLASATPTADFFPVDDFKQVINEVLDRDKGRAFGYQDSKGYLPLRENIVVYLRQNNIQSDVNSIQIISGAQQGIDIISKALLNHGDYVIAESPTYTGAIATFNSRGVNIIKIPIDKAGIDIDSLEKNIKKYKPKLIYTMPNFQNPTGYSYSKEAKSRLIEIANTYNIPIVEDDFSSDLNFYTHENKTLKSMDNSDHVILIKSFSKMFMPGLRLGFLVVPTYLQNKILIAKQVSDISTSGLIQRAFDLYLPKIEMKDHMDKMYGLYKERFDVMIDSLDKYFPSTMEVKKPKGGINFWIGLPKGYSAKKLYSMCLRKGVVFASGDNFYPSERDSRYFRLSIADTYPLEIKEGVERIGSCISEMLNESSDYREASITRPIL